MKTEDQQTYNKQYYDANKKRIIKQVVERQKLIRNSDKYIEDHRDKLINDLNNGTRKFVQYKTLLKYKVNVDPKSLKYYYNSEARTPSEPTTEEEEEHPQQQQRTSNESSNEQEAEAEAEEEGNITLDALKAILEQHEINENDMNKIVTYQKKNKRKRKLIKQIRERFKF